jgi:2-phosphoglycerate kinase
MIYLIGGPPKCGKTSLAKQLSKENSIPWVSTDTLQNVFKPYIDKKEHAKKFPTSQQRGGSNDEKYSKYSTDEIIKAYQKQAKTSYKAIDMFAICEITDGNDFIIEGYHVEPKLVAELKAKYPGKTKSIFLIKKNALKFVANIKKSTTPNDWIIARTKKDETYNKIATMICKYGGIFEKEAKKHGFKCLNMDDNFNIQIKKAIKYLKHG